MTNPKTTAVLCIDFQKEYFAQGVPLQIPGGPAALEKALKIVAAARASGAKVIHIRHISPDLDEPFFAAGKPGVEIIDEMKPAQGEPLVTKTRPGAFYSTELSKILRAAHIETVVICGFMSFMCCDTTAREAQARGFEVLFASDATAAIDLGPLKAETVHSVVCAVQSMAFSKVMSAEEILADLKAG